MGGMPPFMNRAADNWAARVGLPLLNRRGSKIRRIMLMGDSTTVSYNAAYPGGNAGAQANSAVSAMKRALIGAGYQVQDEFFQGTMGFTTGSSFASYDPRITLGSGWDFNAVTAANYGVLRNNSTTNPLIFTPTTPTQTCTLIVRSSNIAGSVTLTYGGVTKTLTIPAVYGFYSVTISATDGVALGNNIATIGRVSGTVDIASLHCYNAKLPAFQLLNNSSSGARAQHIANGTDAGRSLFFPEQLLTAGDECWWMIGPNDWRTSALPPMADFKGYAEAWADRRIANGITPKIILGVRSSLEVATIANMDAYSAALREVAAARGIKVYDVRERWGEFADANAEGLMVGGTDYFHPNYQGAQDLGQFYASIALAA